MTIQDWGAIAEVVAAAAVVVSLIYLAIQVRHHTQELYRQSFRDVYGAYSQFRHSVLDNPEISDLIFKASKESTDLTEPELYRLGYLIEELGWCTQQLYSLVQSGLISEDIWPAGQQRLVQHLRSAAALEWWRTWSHMYDPAMVRDIDLAREEDMVAKQPVAT